MCVNLSVRPLLRPVRHTSHTHPHPCLQTLTELGVSFELKDVSLSEKPVWFSERYATAVGADPESTGKVPLLIDGPFVLAESAVVAEYVVNKYGAEHAKGTALSPNALSPELQARARIFLEQTTSKVCVHPLHHIDSTL
jgi:glutathione S-transferase